MGLFYLAAGLALFFSVHCLQIFYGTRLVLREKLGENAYKGLYSLISAAGLVLISIGFADYRFNDFIAIWTPPIWTRHLALLLNLFATVFIVAAYLPCHMRKALKHPMLVGIKTWAMAHLIANGDLGGMILFGLFLLWAVLVRISLKHRPVENKTVRASWLFDGLAVALGCGLYAVIVFWLHPEIFHIPVWPG